MRERHEYEHEGFESYHAGDDLDACPYDDWRAEAWRDGWGLAWGQDDDG